MVGSVPQVPLTARRCSILNLISPDLTDAKMYGSAGWKIISTNCRIRKTMDGFLRDIIGAHSPSKTQDVDATFVYSYSIKAAFSYVLGEPRMHGGDCAAGFTEYLQGKIGLYAEACYCVKVLLLRL